MRFQQPLPLWTFAAVFLLASMAVGLVGRRLLRPADPTPRSLGELRQRVQQLELGLYLVQNTEADEESGLYLCTTPQPREQLWRLLRASEEGQRWKGVVFCSREGSASRIPESMLESWGKYGMRLGNLLFFGDPALLEYLRNKLVPGRGG